MHGVFHSGYIKTIRRGVANGYEIVYKKMIFPVSPNFNSPYNIINGWGMVKPSPL